MSPGGPIGPNRLVAAARPAGVTLLIAALIVVAVVGLTRAVGKPESGHGGCEAGCCETSAVASADGTFVTNLFDTSDFPARWNCGQWTAGHGWLHVTSDLAIWGAYMAIPIALIVLVFKRKDLPFPSAFWLFGAFILACGTLHLCEAIVFWWPAYRVAGVLKLVTAAISWATVIMLIPLLPRALAFNRTERMNDTLQCEIRERKRMEKAMGDVAAIVDSSGDAISRSAPDGVLTSWNDGAELLYGYSSQEMIGRSFRALVPAELQDEATGILKTVSSGRSVLQFETQRRCKDGSIVDVSLSLSPIHDHEGRVAGISAIARNITERKKAERTLVKLNHELEQKSREMEQFVYSASHDLKSPIVTIQGFIGHLRRDFGAGRTDRLDDFIGRIERASIRMRENIDDLLAFSRIGRVTNDPEDVDVGALVSQLLHEHSMVITELGVEVDVCERLPHVRTDRARMAQVFDNLLVNALKYACGGESPRITVGGYCDNSEARYFVRDNGPGVDEAYHERIFNLFQRLESDLDGSGIGLAIVRRIVEVQGGRAWVESSPGDGATFWIALPSQAGVSSSVERAA